MKRNIIVILTLALVCVLFTACGKEEITQQQYNAAMSKVEEAEAALSAAKAELQNLNQNGGNSAVFANLAAAGQPTPVEKTREEMTEEEKEAYDRAKIAEFAEQVKNDPSIDVGDAVADRLFNDMGCYIGEDGELVPFHMPGLHALPEELQRVGRLDNAVSYCRCKIRIYQDVSREYLEEYFMAHPETIAQLVNLYYEVVDGDTSKEVGKANDRIAEFLAIVPLDAKLSGR